MRSHLIALARRIGLTRTRCPICGVVTERETGSLCEACADSLRPRMGGYCPKCGTMFGKDEGAITDCTSCRLDPPPWDRLYFYAHYSGKLRDLILGYKFNNGLGRTQLLSSMALDAFALTPGRIPDMIIPVPLHRRRLMWRGYNQSTQLCGTLGKVLDRPICDMALTRVRHTRPQTRLDRHARQSNIKEAFAANAELVQGKNVLLVDDVYTTGATLAECSRTLNQAGTAGVDVLVLARAQQE